MHLKTRGFGDQKPKACVGDLSSSETYPSLTTFYREHQKAANDQHRKAGKLVLTDALPIKTQFLLLVNTTSTNYSSEMNKNGQTKIPSMQGSNSCAGKHIFECG